MKRVVLIILSLIITLCCAFMVACGETETPPPPVEGGSGGGDGGGDGGGENLPVEITGVTFNGIEVTYDGEEHEIEVSGTLPEGVTVQYENNKGTNAGTYNAVATLTGANYVTKTLNATLKINKAEITGVTFKGETFDYDGTEKSIEITGLPPANSDVVYSCKENDDIENSAKESGSYTIVVTITNPNYITLTLEAVMKIQGEEEQRYIYKQDDNLYFANALDNDYLYVYDGEAVELVSMDIPYNFTEQDGNLFFRSKALFGNVVKSITVTTSADKTTYEVSSAVTCKGEYLINDGTYFYYAVNGLTQASSGIYKIDISANEEEEPTKIYEGKAKYLQYYDGAIYFADGQNEYKLTKLNLSNNAKTLVRDAKISTLTCDNGYLFYTVNNLLGDYIENYKISNGIYRKLTSDAGANLTLVGNNLYYINVDILTSYVNGDGIYYVNAFPALDMNGKGTKLVGENTFSSLIKTGDDEIAYYRVSDQMLILHDLTTNETVEVLDGFVAPERSVFSTGSKTGVYNGALYFMDLHKEKCLFRYNPTTDKFTKITANKVTDFAIVGDYLYYNMVSVLVNNDLYRINLRLGGEPEKVSTFDCVDIAFVNDRVFYVEQNASGARTAIREINADGEDIMLYSKGVNNLRAYEGYLYFEDGGKLYKMPTTDYVKDEATVVYDDKTVGNFEIDNGVIYFRELSGFLNATKHLCKMNIDGSGYARIVEQDPVDILIADGYVYFYSDTASEKIAGIFKVAVGSTTVTQVLARKVDGTSYYPTELSKIGNDLYFINYTLGGVGCDSHLYKVNLQTSALTKVTK